MQRYVEPPIFALFRNEETLLEFGSVFVSLLTFAWDKNISSCDFPAEPIPRIHAEVVLFCCNEHRTAPDTASLVKTGTIWLTPKFPWFIPILESRLSIDGSLSSIDRPFYRYWGIEHRWTSLQWRAVHRCSIGTSYRLSTWIVFLALRNRHSFLQKVGSPVTRSPPRPECRKCQFLTESAAIIVSMLLLRTWLCRSSGLLG